MRTVWFKQKYVAPILAGEKQDTIRRASNRLPQAGEMVAFSVGPRPPFAFANITAVEPLGDLPAWRRAQVKEIYGELPADAVQLRFQIANAEASASAAGAPA